MEIHISQHDFDRLCESSMRWAGNGWEAQDGRFEVSERTAGEPINWKAKMIYWVGESAAALVLARSYVLDKGFDVQVLWDMNEFPGGHYAGYALVTDYETDHWADRDAGIVIRADAGQDSQWYPPEEE